MVGDWDAYQGNELVNGVLQQFQEQRNHNAAHEIKSINRNGPLIPLAHDAKGNLTLDEDGNTYTWDFDNRLKEVRDANGDLLGAYTYDALGRRTTKTVPGNLPGDPQVTTAFVCMTDASGGGMGQILAEYEDNTLKRMYAYGSYIDEPLAMDHFDANLSGGVETLYYHRDRQYNLIGLTDGSGMVQERYAYTPYGERRILAPDGVIVRQTSAVGNPLGHQGLYHDGETNLIYNRARYMGAGLGRWLGRDPLGYVDGLNFYQITFSQPINWLDPTGLLSYGPKSECDIYVEKIADIANKGIDRPFPDRINDLQYERARDIGRRIAEYGMEDRTPNMRRARNALSGRYRNLGRPPGHPGGTTGFQSRHTAGNQGQQGMYSHLSGSMALSLADRHQLMQRRNAADLRDLQDAIQSGDARREAEARAELANNKSGWDAGEMIKDYMNGNKSFQELLDGLKGELCCDGMVK